MTAWRWIRADLVYAVHDMQLMRHGGLDGIRDKNAIESALARPQQLEHYADPKPDAASLAAAYGYGIARNHGFNDGNKRTAWVLARLFIADNGLKLTFTEFDAIKMMLAVAGGTASEDELAEWFRSRIVISAQGN
jgi:death on curing protein